MANRTTFEKVKQIYDTNLENENIEQYISIASMMVDDIAAVGTLSADRLAQIERFLTAHLIITTKERRGIEEELGEARIKYADVFGPGLQSTEFGQMVSQLDTTGTLASEGKKKVYFKAITSFE